MKVSDYLKNQYSKPGPAANAASPKYGFKRYSYIVKNHFFRLIGVNALFVLFCAPIITIPASFSGMTKILMNLTRNGESFIWHDFWQEFKSDFIVRVCIWFGLQLIPLCGWYIPHLLGAEAAGIWISSIVGSFIFLMESYWFPMITSLSIGPMACLKNAFFLVFLEWKKSALILMIGVLGFFTWMLFYPYSLPLLLLLLFSLTQLGICVTVNEPMQKRIIDPHGQK